MTRADGFYEPGVFDVRSSVPRPTAIAAMLQALAEGREYSHPLLDLPGWWQRSQRLLYPPVSYSQTAGGWIDTDPSQVVRSPEMRCTIHSDYSAACVASPLLIAGATGTLGQAFARLCEVRGIPYYLLSRQEMDITDPTSVEQTLKALTPGQSSMQPDMCGSMRLSESHTCVIALTQKEPLSWHEPVQIKTSQW